MTRTPCRNYGAKWNPDPEFIRQFEGPLLFNEKHEPYREMFLRAEKPPQIEKKVKHCFLLA